MRAAVTPRSARRRSYASGRSRAGGPAGRGPDPGALGHGEPHRLRLSGRQALRDRVLRRPAPAAATGTEGSHYALSGIRKLRVGSGDDVLVHGATGAQVTATSPTGQLELVRGLGADRVIDHRVQDFTQDGGRYDLVIDAVGKSTFGSAGGC